MSNLEKTRYGQTEGGSDTADGPVGVRLDRAFWPLVVLSAVLLALLAALVWHSTDAGSVDHHVAALLYAKPGSIIRSLFSTITRFGSPAVAIAASLAIAVWIWRRFRDRLMAAFCPAVVVSAAIAESLTKAVVQRSRPATAAAAHVHGLSFPSGHATAAAALAVGISVLLPAAGVHHRRLAGFVLTGYVVLIGLSRLVLGVHYLTDVVAGIVLGATTVVICAGLWPRMDLAHTLRRSRR